MDLLKLAWTVAQLQPQALVLTGAHSTPLRTQAVPELLTYIFSELSLHHVLQLWAIHEVSKAHVEKTSYVQLARPSWSWGLGDALGLDFIAPVACKPTFPYDQDPEDGLGLL